MHASLLLNAIPETSELISIIEFKFWFLQVLRSTTQRWRKEEDLPEELGDISYLESPLEVCQFFKDAGCYRFCEKIQGSHQQVAEAFSLSFNGSKALIGKEEFLVDESIIIEVTELRRNGEKWVNTTITKNVEFRSYLKPEHRNVIWNKVFHPHG